MLIIFLTQNQQTKRLHVVMESVLDQEPKTVRFWANSGANQLCDLEQVTSSLRTVVPSLLQWTLNKTMSMISSQRCVILWYWFPLFLLLIYHVEQHSLQFLYPILGPYYYFFFTKHKLLLMSYITLKMSTTVFAIAKTILLNLFEVWFSKWGI